MPLAPSKTKTYRKIKKEIENWVAEHSPEGVKYQNWYCGITNDPNKRYAGHKHRTKEEPYFFFCRNARSLRLSCKLETSFHSFGMLDTDLLGNAKDNSIYIYVFKIKATLWDKL